MRMWTKLLIPMLMVAMVGVADAKGSKKTHLRHHRKHEHRSTATIQSVHGSDVTINMHARRRLRGKTAVVHTTSQTAISVNGVSGKSVSNLKKGQRVAVSLVGTTAKSISAADGRVTRVRHHKKKK